MKQLGAIVGLYVLAGLLVSVAVALKPRRARNWDWLMWVLSVSLWPLFIFIAIRKLREEEEE